MTTRPRGPAAKQIIIPKHRCVADTNTMMRASQHAPIYNCRIRGCGKLVYSNGSPVSVDDYNMQIALAMIKENKPPAFWICFNLDGKREFMGAYSTKKRALARLQKKFGDKCRYATSKGFIGVSRQMYSKKGVILKGKQRVATAVLIKVNVKMKMEI